MKMKIPGWTVTAVAAEYFIAVFLVVYHYSIIKSEPYGLNTLPVEFFTIVGTCIMALVSLVLYTLAIWVVQQRVSKALRITLMVLLLLPLWSSAGLLSIALLIDMASGITIVAAFISGLMVLQMPVLIYRLVVSTR